MHKIKHEFILIEKWDFTTWRRKKKGILHRGNKMDKGRILKYKSGDGKETSQYLLEKDLVKYIKKFKIDLIGNEKNNEGL